MRVQAKDLTRLQELLDKTTIPINYDRGRTLDKGHGSRHPAGVGRTVLFGYNPYNKKNLTKFTQQHPDIYLELRKLAFKYVPFTVNKIMLNKNYQTQPHYDSKNSTKSVIFSFGDYKGGELVVEGKVIDTNMKTYEMNGATQLHWNKPITAGTKYSLVFYS